MRGLRCARLVLEITATRKPQQNHMENAPESNNTTVHQAAKEGNLEVLKLLIGNVSTLADINREDSSLETPLEKAIIGGHLEVIKVLQQLGATARRPMHLAASNGHLEIVKYMLEQGVNVNDEQQSPLFLASKNGHTEVVAFLLKHGATVNTQSNTKSHPRSQNRNTDMLAFVENQMRGMESPLYVAAQKGHVEVVKVLLEYGANVKLGSTLGHTPLYIASEAGHSEIVELLLNHGAPVEQLALIIACENGHLLIVQLLLQRGASVNTASSYYETPLFSAIHYGHFSIASLLLASGALMDERTRTLSCLHQTILANRLDVAEQLINAYPELVSRDHLALFYATQSTDSNSTQVVRLLLQHGAKVNHEVFGHPVVPITALYAAVTSRQADKVWLLVRYGADTTRLYTSGSTNISLTVMDVCPCELIREALLHLWTPRSHKLFPEWTKDAILCTLLVSKRQRWPFDAMLLHKILAYVAYGWY